MDAGIGITYTTLLEMPCTHSFLLLLLLWIPNAVVFEFGFHTIYILKDK